MCVEPKRSAGTTMPVAGVALALGVAAPAISQTLPAATVTLQCNLDDKDERRIDFADTVFSRADSIVFNGACDVTVSGTDFDFTENADGFAVSGPEPQVEAIADSSARVFGEAGAPDCEIESAGFIDARVAMRFSIAVNEKAVPRFRPDSIPTRALILGQLDVSVEPPNSGPPGENEAIAAVQFSGADGTVLLMRSAVVETGSRTVEVSESVTRDFLFDDTGPGDFAVLEFDKTAFAQTSSHVRGPCPTPDGTRASARALIDPTFEFDQARFDEIHGANSFPLADFYEILASPNLFDLLFDDGFDLHGGSP